MELTQQLQVAAARVEEAEARAAAPGDGEAAQRLAAAERFAQEAGQRAREVETRATAAEARVSELEARLVEASQANMQPLADGRIAELERAAREAMAAAADSARRAEATEAVRDELETKVAQFGSRAAELEATTAAVTLQLREVEAAKADLERRAHEAESGGDAVRGEMAQLTAERDALRARIVELEAAPPTTTNAPRTEELEQQLDATRMELEQMDQRLRIAYADLAQARSLQREPDPAAAPREDPHALELRQELARAIERAQVAEERATKLEADLLAERHGIRSLDEGAEPEARTERDHEPELDPELDPALDPELEPIPAFRSMVPSPSDGNGTSETNGDAQEGDKSLRFRLAQSAARKKGLGDLEPPSS
jgi:myosin heavy subunit